MAKNYIKEFMKDHKLKTNEMFKIIPIDLLTSIVYKDKKFFFESYGGTEEIIALNCVSDCDGMDYSGSAFAPLLRMTRILPLL